MFKKIVLLSIVSLSYSMAMSATMVQSAEKGKLGCIKGIGLKRMNAILEYRKRDTIDTLEEMLNIKGIGKGILKNIKNDVQKKSCLVKENQTVEKTKIKKVKKRKAISAK